MNATSNQQIEGLARWSEPKPVTTSRGARLLRTAEPTPAFWAAWRADKEALKAAGVSCGKNRQTTEWEVCWWQQETVAVHPEPEAVVAEAAESIFGKRRSILSETRNIDTTTDAGSLARENAEVAADAITGSQAGESAQRSPGDSGSGQLGPSSIVLSSEQVAIHEYMASGEGNAVVDAKAGTGKTFTITHGFARVPQAVAEIYYLVFNKKNQKEALAKITDPRVTVLTLNACGWRFLRSVWRDANMPGDSGVDVEATRIDAVAPGTPDEAITALKRLIGFAKNLFVGVPTAGQLQQVCTERNIFCGLQTEAGEDEYPAARLATIAVAAMQRALDKLEDHKCVDFGDQVWLPVSKGWVRPCADFVVVDETQDMNLPQLVMVQRMARKGGRVMVVGDPRQCIYTFRGAHPDGMAMMTRELKAAVLSLSITRRCPKAVVRHVQPTVPGYQAADDAPEGSVGYATLWDLTQTAKPGDAVLSRANAPLVSTCLALLRKGTPARIEGRDIGRQLVGMVKSLKAKSVPDFLRKLERWADKQKSRIVGKNSAAKEALVNDQRDTLAALAEGCANVAEVETRIRSLFQDSDDAAARPAVVLSSVHKAKGLEWDKVSLLSWTFNKSWKGQTDEQKREEENIYYVACTRAKRDLVMVSEDNNPRVAENPDGTKEVVA